MISILFNSHWSYYLSYFGMNISYVIGFLVFILFSNQFSSGILLCCYYVPFHCAAFNSINYLNIDVTIGFMIRWFHYVGASMYFLCLLLHLLRAIFLWHLITINYTMHYSIISGILIFITSLGAGFMGYILVFGQMSYWGITVIINVLTIFQYLGIIISQWIFCSTTTILNRLFIIHIILGLITGLFILVHLMLIHYYYSSNSRLNSTSSLLLVLHSLFFKDCLLFIALSIIPIVFLFIEPDVLGNTDNLIEPNAIATPPNIIPEWYLLVFYCWLRIIPSKALGVLNVIILSIGIPAFGPSIITIGYIIR